MWLPTPKCGSRDTAHEEWRNRKMALTKNISLPVFEVCRLRNRSTSSKLLRRKKVNGDEWRQVERRTEHARSPSLESRTESALQDVLTAASRRAHCWVTECRPVCRRAEKLFIVPKQYTLFLLFVLACVRKWKLVYICDNWSSSITWVGSRAGKT